MNHKITAALLLVITMAVGCTRHQQNRTEFHTSKLGSYESEFPDDSKIEKVTRQKIGQDIFEDYKDFLLAHVEFDDQGQFWETERDGDFNQLDALEKRIHDEMKSDPIKYKKGAVIVAFAHGWFNNSEEGNGNLDQFRNMMSELVKDSKKSGKDVPHIGVYLSWRGLRSIEVPVLDTINRPLTYWDRKQTAHNIGHRAMGETLRRLSVLRNEIVTHGEGIQPKNRNLGRSRVVLVGHSFGAAAIYSGVSRYFEDELIKVERSNYKRSVGRAWDLVVLINPAFEALQYEAIDRYSSKIPLETESQFVQMPRMLILSAENDSATGMFLPIGQTLGDLFRPRQRSEHLDQNRRLTTALGHYDPFFTHQLVLEGKSAKLKPFREFENRYENCGATCVTDFTPVHSQDFLSSFESVFSKSASVKRTFPFMVARADSDVIDNHNGIWKDPLRQFVSDFIHAREDAAMALLR